MRERERLAIIEVGFQFSLFPPTCKNLFWNIILLHIYHTMTPTQGEESPSPLHDIAVIDEKTGIGRISSHTITTQDANTAAESPEASTLAPDENQPQQAGKAFQSDYRFWMIMVTLCFSVLLSSLESTVVITSLPTIVAELKIGSNYIWVTNVFLLARYVSLSIVFSLMVSHGTASRR